MRYRTNDAPDSKKVRIELTMRQVKMLERLAQTTLQEVMDFGEYDGFTAKALEKLCDRFWDITHIPMTPEEEEAATGDWVKSFTHKDFVRAHGFDPYAGKEVQS
ncbi:MAG: hypothetical protein CVU15_08590 [Betaproteobacteria bacterium HGW-Betaproteobacteria-1]|jgi:hypothetical protein|nr:MAG: hypothetical protein CVU15_08590 [Betaproteobacteria bacterium HGW-Betaproteobacteria-1]